MEENRLTIRTEQFAEELDVSQTTIYRLMKNDPDFPDPIRTRRRVMWFKTDVAKYLEKKQGISRTVSQEMEADQH